MIFIYFPCCAQHKVKPPRIPNKLSFAGERVPLERQDVLESLDRELIVNQNYHSSTLTILKRMNRYKGKILKILKENSVPEDFFYLAVAESSLKDRASSYAGAVGIWQFLESTAKEYGLEVSETVDERRHLEKSTEAACRYLHNSYKKFKNWTLVAASYNRGVRGMQNAISDQKVDSYYELYLNSQTARYVYRILALKVILTNPSDYNFEFNQSMSYPIYKYKTLKISHSIDDLPDFAKKNNITYKELVLHNPWIQNGKYKFEAKEGKVYNFLIPE